MSQKLSLCNSISCLSGTHYQWEGKRSHIGLTSDLKGNRLLLTDPNKRNLVIIYVLSQVKTKNFPHFFCTFLLSSTKVQNMFDISILFFGFSKTLTICNILILIYKISYSSLVKPKIIHR